MKKQLLSLLLVVFVIMSVLGVVGAHMINEDHKVEMNVDGADHMFGDGTRCSVRNCTVPDVLTVSFKGSGKWNDPYIVTGELSAWDKNNSRPGCGIGGELIHIYYRDGDRVWSTHWNGEVVTQGGSYTYIIGQNLPPTGLTGVMAVYKCSDAPASPRWTPAIATLTW
ncbi:MAG TPA: hypothetical protein VEG44_07490 [Candidatus Acidoferrales bacterium]|nr:hypothetical protein [Candidatus Acidoferrales bacterium]